jgi:hypothetical protein
MAKVIVERPRQGGGAPFPLRSEPDFHRLNIEDWRSRQSMRRPWMTGRYKHLNENLAPLRRYVQSQVGRPWSKVYSEICKHINRDSAVQLHIWQHLMVYVCVDVHSRGNYRQATLERAEFFVQPKTGLLRKNPYRRRWPSHQRPAPASLDRVAGEGFVQYRRLEGIWYELRLANIPASRDVFDFAVRQNVKSLSPTMLNDFHGRFGVYAAAKRQLNSKEIRRLGLKPSEAD